MKLNKPSDGECCAQQEVEEAGWIQVGRPSPVSAESDVQTEDDKQRDPVDGTNDDEKNPFKIPAERSAWLLWFLSLPWNAAFAVTVPNCKKVNFIKL